jgi:hypothetical protein
MKKYFDVAYCFGAAIVILGAWGKITHVRGANILLTIGLLSEVVLFVLQGIQILRGESTPVGDVTVNVDMSETNSLIKKGFRLGSDTK